MEHRDRTAAPAPPIAPPAARRGLRGGGFGSYGSILVENNYFQDVNNPYQFMYDVWMYSAASGNVFDNASGAQDEGLGGSRDACPDGDCSSQEDFDPGPFDPPYAYDLGPGEGVPDIVTRCAGPR